MKYRISNGMLWAGVFLAGCSNPVSAPAPPTSAAVVQAFKDGGMPIASTAPMTRQDYGMAPLLATEGTHFTISTLKNGGGGRAFTFSSNDDRDKMKKYYDELGKTSAAFYSHTLTANRVLVQINGDVPDTEAKKYQDLLAKVAGLSQ